MVCDTISAGGLGPARRPFARGLPWAVAFLASSSLAVVGTVGCGNEATLYVRLRMDADDPELARVETLGVFLLDEARRELVGRVEPFSSTGVVVPPIPYEPGASITVEVFGYGRDVEDLVAAGAGTVRTPRDVDACCALVCFCAMALYEGDACDCGNNRCVANCRL